MTDENSPDEVTGEAECPWCGEMITATGSDEVDARNRAKSARKYHGDNLCTHPESPHMKRQH